MFARRLAVIVLAHNDVSEGYFRHVPLWAKLDAGWQTVSPATAKLGVPREYSSGENRNFCLDQQLRLRLALSVVAEREADWYLIFEWDSIPLGFSVEGLPEGCLFGNFVPDDARGAYQQAPWICRREVLLKLIERYPEELFLGGAQDRCISEAARRAGVPLCSFGPHGYSSSATDGAIRAEEHAALKQAILEGAVYIHGVKDVATWAVCVDTVDRKVI